MLWILATALAADPGSPMGGMRVETVLETLPPCIRTTAAQTPTLDLGAGCVLGKACAGMSLEALEAVLGPAECKRSTCAWRDGTISTVTNDENLRTGSSVFVKSSEYRTADGIGVGSSASCLLEGKADQIRSIDVEVREGQMYLELVWIKDPRVGVKISHDGTIVQLQMSGSPRSRK